MGDDLLFESNDGGENVTIPEMNLSRAGPTHQKTHVISPAATCFSVHFYIFLPLFSLLTWVSVVGRPGWMLSLGASERDHH